MGCLATLAIAGVTGLAGLLLGFFAGDIATRVLGVSDFDRFIERHYRARPLPRAGYPGAARELALGDARLAVSAGDDRVSLWGRSSRIVAEIGVGFDEELASGAHDALFQTAR